MKKVQTIILSGLCVVCSACGGWQRIGDLTIASTRNIDSSKKHVLLERTVTAKASAGHDALKIAIDDACKKAKGEYLTNVRVYIKNNGKKVKIEGDVWGDESERVEPKIK